MFKRIVCHVFKGAGIKIGGDEPWDIQVHDPRFFRRAVVSGSLGVGDAYTDGDFTCNDTAEFLQKWMRHRLQRRQDKLKRSARGVHRRPLPKSLPDLAIRIKLAASEQQDILRSKRVGERHYDIGNVLYRLMLGPTMAYSCAYWPGAKNLDQAQRNKYRVICEKLGLKRGMRVLEIGCGWGGFAAYAVEKYGVTVVGVSISQEQIDSIKVEHKESCETGKLDLRFLDYREIPQEFKEEFDAIVSIGMFEHVGPDNYDDYMRVAWSALKPGGKFLLHSIVGNGGVDAFIWYRVFVGGVLPMEEQITHAAKPYFNMEHMENFGFDYSRTMLAWWENFKAAWPEIRKDPRYDEKFYRMWEFYLKSCAMAFKVRRIHLQQWMMTKPANDNEDKGYQWNRPVYEAA